MYKEALLREDDQKSFGLDLVRHGHRTDTDATYEGFWLTGTWQRDDRPDAH